MNHCLSNTRIIIKYYLVKAFKSLDNYFCKKVTTFGLLIFLKKVDAITRGEQDALNGIFFKVMKSNICLKVNESGTSAKTPSEQIVTEGNGISLKDNPVVATVVTTGLLSQSSYKAYVLNNHI